MFKSTVAEEESDKTDEECSSIEKVGHREEEEVEMEEEGAKEVLQLEENRDDPCNESFSSEDIRCVTSTCR